MISISEIQIKENPPRGEPSGGLKIRHGIKLVYMAAATDTATTMTRNIIQRHHLRNTQSNKLTP
jgi:hypothetical protein